MAFSRFIQFNVTVNTLLSPTTVLSEVSFNGTSFTFDEPTPVGSFSEAGFPNHLFVVAPADVGLTATSPATQDVGGYLANGVMANPRLTNSLQGWDEFLTAAAGTSSAGIPYDDSLNLDPSKPGGSPQTITVGTTLVKALPRSARSEGTWQPLDGYVHLHVVSDVPPLGAFPPASSALNTDIIGTIYEIDWNVLRSLPLSGLLSETAVSAAALLPQDCAEWGASRSDDYRILRQDAAVNEASSNYAGDYADLYARAMLVLHDSATPTALRNEIAYRLIGWGIQISALLDRGSNLFGGAGQGGGLHGPLFTAALLLQNATLLANAQSAFTQMVHPRWLTASDVGARASGKSGTNAQTILDEQVGTPHVIPDEFGSNLDARYLDIGTNNTIWELLAVLVCQSGRFLGSGPEVVLGGETANDIAGDNTAPIAYMDRVRTWAPWMIGRNPGQEFKSLYDLIQPLTNLTPWTGVPDQVPYGKSAAYDDDIFSAGAGAISWDIAGFEYATEPVTSRDVEYALDFAGSSPVQFVRESDAGVTGTKTGLLRGAAHWARIRQNSASGSGAFSANYPESGSMTDGSGKGKVTPTGSEVAAAPSNSIAPTIHQRLYPAWSFKMWEPAPASLGVNDVELACGLGYWTGFPAPTFTFQWKRDGVNIAGATAQSYVRTAEDAEAALFCDLTATNTGGSVTVATMAVASPNLAILPMGILMDTDFAGAFAIDYSTEFSNKATKDASLDHLPTKTFSGLNGYLPGALHLNKTGSYPYGWLPLQENLVPSTTYRLQAELVVTENTTGSVFVRISNGPSSTINYDGANFTTATTDAEVFDVDLLFSVGGGETNLDAHVFFGHNTATGGSSGGDLYLTRLKLSTI